MIRSSCFEFGLYGIRPCGSRTRPVRDIVDGYPTPVWAGGGRIVRVTISDCKSASRRPIEKLRFPNAWRLGCPLKILPVFSSVAECSIAEGYKR